MTATVTRPAGSETAERGETTLARVNASRAWPEGRGDETARARDGLRDSLEIYDAIHAGILSPESVYPEVTGEDEAYDLALGKAAEDISDWCGYLDEIVPAAAAAGDGGES